MSYYKKQKVGIEELNQRLCKEIQMRHSNDTKMVLIEKNLEVVDRVLNKFESVLPKEEIEDLWQDGIVLLLEIAEAYSPKTKSSKTFRATFTDKYISTISKKISLLEKSVYLDDVKEVYTMDQFIRTDWEDKCSIFMKDLDNILVSMVSTLPDKYQLVIHYRFECNMTLDDIGEKLGVTRSRIQQIIAKSIRLLRYQAYHRKYRKYNLYDFLIIRDDPCITNIYDVSSGVRIETKKALSSNDTSVLSNGDASVLRSSRFYIWVPRMPTHQGATTIKDGYIKLRMTFCDEDHYTSDALLAICSVGPRKLVALVDIRIVTDSIKMDKVTTKIPIDIVSDVDLLSIDTEREFIKGIFCAAIDLALTQLNEKERSALLFTHSELTTIEENADLEEFSTELLTLIRNNIKLWEG